MIMITKETVKEFVSKVTKLKVEEVEPNEDEEWHLRVKYPYEGNVLNSVHIVRQKDGKLILSKYKAIEYPREVNTGDLEI